MSKAEEKSILDRVQSCWIPIKQSFIRGWLSFSQYERAAALIFAGIFTLFALMLWNVSKLELVPTSFGAIATAAFAFLAFRFSKERFRLDLSHERWKIYENLVIFCSLAMQTGLTSKEAIAAADGSFRGMGYHRSRSLFGMDIAELLGKLNESYSWLISHGNAPEGDTQRDDWAEKSAKHEGFVWETVNKLPEHFKGYLYFGDYRR